MRINIYGEELTNRVEVIKKTVDQRLFVGIRFYLKSHNDLHHSESDNDESAVTFWCPWTKKHGNNFSLLFSMFDQAINLLSLCETEKTREE